jgi:hypothetical protein
VCGTKRAKWLTIDLQDRKVLPKEREVVECAPGLTGSCREAKSYPQLVPHGASADADNVLRLWMVPAMSQPGGPSSPLTDLAGGGGS